MSIDAVSSSAVSPTMATTQAGGPSGDASSERTAAGDASGSASFAGLIDQLQSVSGARDDAAVKAMSGDAHDVHDATVAATVASTTAQVYAAVRNKLVDGFNEVMRMQG